MQASNSLPITIRHFDRSRDYPARAHLHNATFPGHPATEEELRNWDSKDNPDPKYLNVRLVAELDDEARTSAGERVVAFLWYGHRPGLYHPRKLHFNLLVHPEFRSRGIGSRLYQQMLEGVEAHDPVQLMSGTYANQTEGLAFLEHRGFRERMRAWESFLDVSAFDPTPFEGALEKVAAAGIEIRSEADLSDDPEFERKLYEMFMEVIADVPAPDPFTPPPFERFQETRKNDINRIPEAFFVAIDGSTGDYAGTSALWRLHAADYVNTGLTGVRRAYRRKGLALALKLTAIDWARRNGVSRIRTDNESNNRPMLSINEMLGFERGTAEVAMVKSLSEG